MAPFRHQVKQIAWDPLKRLAGVIPGATFNESELRCDLPGDKRIQLYGSDNGDAIRGVGLDGAVCDEFGHSDAEVFPRVLRPALADRAGWVLFIGTPNGRNHFHTVYQRAQQDADSYAVLYRASDSGVLPADELEAAKPAIWTKPVRLAASVPCRTSGRRPWRRSGI